MPNTAPTDYLNFIGTVRSQTPNQTIGWLKTKLSRVGITRVANITGLDHIGIPITTCMRPNSKHLSVSQGKGLSLPLAEISAIMESIEGYHAENPPTIAFVGNYHELKQQHPLISPVYFNQTQFNKDGLIHYPLTWIKACNLIDNQVYYIPHILSCIDSTVWRPEYAFLKVSSNGLAAGNTMDEAICHALYEVIERDALTRWQALPSDARKQTQVNLSTIKSQANEWLLNQLYQANMTVKVWEITSKINVPTFHCAIDDTNAILRGLGLFTGTGAHLLKEIALSRAITEAVQSRLTLITGNRDDIFPNYYHHMRAANTFIRNRKFEPGIRNYANCCTPTFHSSFKGNIRQILGELQSHQHKYVLLVNHTKADIAVPVVQVFIPSMLYNSTRMIL